MKKLVLAIACGCLLNAGAQAQGFKDLIREIGKAARERVDQQVTEKVEGPCLEKQASARVERVDSGKSGTWVVQTTDGTTYQLSNISIAGVMEDGTAAGNYLSMGRSAAFSLVDQSRLTKTYRVHLEFAPADGNGSGVRGFLSGIVNSTAQRTLPNDLKFVNGGVGGTSLDGADWCLNVPTTTIQSIWVVQ